MFSAPKRTRTSTPVRAQVLNLPRMPIPPLGQRPDYNANSQSCQLYSCPKTQQEYNILMMRIPIYPSPNVIFPGQLLAIQHPTEAIEQALQANLKTQQLIGIAYAPPHNPHALSRIGTLAQAVGRLQSPGLDAMPITVAGKARFRMVQIHYEQPYPEATFQLWPWMPNPPPPWSDVETLGQYLKRYIDALTIILPPTLIPEAMQQNAGALGILGAALLQIPAQAKQHLLEIPTTRELVHRVLHYMQIYVPLTERLATNTKTTQPVYEGVSLN